VVRSQPACFYIGFDSHDFRSFHLKIWLAFITAFRLRNSREEHSILLSYALRFDGGRVVEHGELCPVRVAHGAPHPSLRTRAIGLSDLDP